MTKHQSLEVMPTKPYVMWNLLNQQEQERTNITFSEERMKNAFTSFLFPEEEQLFFPFALLAMGLDMLTSKEVRNHVDHWGGCAASCFVLFVGEL